MPVSFEFDFDKALSGLVYLASKPDLVPEFDKYKAAKLLFLADKYHLVRYGKPIFGDDYRALELGPVPQQILDLLHMLVGDRPLHGARAEKLAEVLAVDARYRYPRMHAKVAPNLEALSVSELRALDHVIALHGKRSFAELRALTHEIPAYRRVWDTRPEGIEAVAMKYEDFFDEDPEAMAGAREEMLENDALRKAFPGL